MNANDKDIAVLCCIDGKNRKLAANASKPFGLSVIGIIHLNHSEIRGTSVEGSVMEPEQQSQDRI